MTASLSQNCLRSSGMVLKLSCVSKPPMELLKKLQVPRCTPDFLQNLLGLGPEINTCSRLPRSGSDVPPASTSGDLGQDPEQHAIPGSGNRSSKKVSVPRDGPLIKEK